MVVRMLVAAVASLALFASSASAALVIDSFDVTSQSVSDTTVGGVVSDTAAVAPDTIGGSRTITIDKTSPMNAAAANLEVVAALSTLVYENEGSGAGGSVSSVGTSEYLGLGSADLTAGGGTALTLEDVFTNVTAGGSITVEVTITDGDSSATVTITGADLANGSLGDLSEPFSSWGGIDFTDIESIVVTITGTNGSDIDIGGIVVAEIPEPASMAIWSVLGIAVVGGRRYLRRKANKS